MHVVAEFGVSDFVGDEPTPVAQLAAKTGMNADALDRILRLLAGHGVFAREPHGYIHTEASRVLRSDHPHSMRSFGRMMGMPVIWQRFTELGQTAKTGKPTVDWAGLVAYFAEHPEEASVFNQAMVGRSGNVVPAVLGAYDFTPFGKIADIGGGRGHLLQAILQSTPSASGILFDLPHVIADASGAASARLQLVAGDFFRDVLPSADAYVLMEVIHDWADEEAADILSAVRRVAPAHARLIIVETLVSQEPGPHFGKVLDVVMLAVTGGRERTASEYDALLRSAGFRLERIIPTPSQHSVVEAVVA
jgi:hypothetical protein